MLYESLLLLGVLAVAFVLPNVLIGLSWGARLPAGLLWLNVFLVLLAYFVGYWCRSGQTLAMQTWGIRLVAAPGGAVSRKRALIRYLLAWPSLLLCGTGLLWAVVDAEHQFLHDRLAGTRLVRA